MFETETLLDNYYCETACNSAHIMQSSLRFTDLPYSSIWLQLIVIFETRYVNLTQQNMIS